MGCGPSFSTRIPREDEFLKPVLPLDCPFMLDSAVEMQKLRKFRIRAGDNVKDENGKLVLKVIGIDEDGRRLNGHGHRQNRLVTLTNKADELIAAWETKEDGFTYIYALVPRVKGTPAASVPVWDGVAGPRSETLLYPFARIDGGREEGMRNIFFRIYLATGPSGAADGSPAFNQVGYQAFGCGGNFWRIHKGGCRDGPGACIVGPARLHLSPSYPKPFFGPGNFYPEDLSGASACVVGPGMDPILLLAACLVKNMDVVGPIPGNPGGLILDSKRLLLPDSPLLDSLDFLGGGGLILGTIRIPRGGRRRCFPRRPQFPRGSPPGRAA